MSTCKKCRVIRSITIVGVLLLIVVLTNLEKFAA